MGDDFGDRMKMYEAHGNPGLLPGLPVCARLDGRGFHSFTRHAKRPFSEALHRMMVDVTRHLVVESCATVGYTQSDEISLVWTDHPFFEGNPHKLCSTLAAMASVRLHEHSYVTAGGDGDLLSYPLMGDVRIEREAASGLAWGLAPTFDCRVWVVPSLVEAANVILWRQQDAARNATSTYAVTRTVPRFSSRTRRPSRTLRTLRETCRGEDQEVTMATEETCTHGGTSLTCPECTKAAVLADPVAADAYWKARAERVTGGTFTCPICGTRTLHEHSEMTFADAWRALEAGLPVTLPSWPVGTWVYLDGDKLQMRLPDGRQAEIQASVMMLRATDWSLRSVGKPSVG